MGRSHREKKKVSVHIFSIFKDTKEIVQIK